MNISAPFIARPVATTLITLGVALAGILGFQLLPLLADQCGARLTLDSQGGTCARWHAGHGEDEGEGGRKGGQRKHGPSMRGSAVGWG